MDCTCKQEAYDEGYSDGQEEHDCESLVEDFPELFKDICTGLTFDYSEEVTIRYDAAQKAIVLFQGGREEILR